MASKGDFRVEKLPYFYELLQACVNVITLKPLIPVCYKNT